MRLPIVTALATFLLTVRFTAQPATRPAADAWPLYRDAAARIREGDAQGLSSPAASAIEYSYPPFSDAWKRHEKQAYDFNASALQKVREAASIDRANWPVERKGNDVSLKYLNELRNIANEVADAAIYDHLQGNDASALSRLHDVLHIADLLDEPKDELLVQGLVACGLRALALHDLEMIAPELPLTKDLKSDAPNAVSTDAVRALIRQLFTTDDAGQRVDALLDHERALNPATTPDPTSTERARTTYRRGQMERNLAAMSLACQLDHFEKSHWPATLDDLLPYLPAKPTDFWGPMGYVLIKSDGPDRPMVYSRCNAQPGQTLAYPSGASVYGYYQPSSFGLKAQPLAGGQFRDVSEWLPPKGQPIELRQLK